MTRSATASWILSHWLFQGLRRDFVNSSIQIQEMPAEGALHSVFALGQLNEQFFQRARITPTQPMNLAHVLTRIGLNGLMPEGALNQAECVRARERRQFDSREFIKLLPHVSDRFRLITPGHDPNGDSLSERRDKTGDTRWRQYDMIEHDRLATPPEIGEQPVLSLDDVQFVMRPAKLSFDSIANATEARGLLAMEEGATLAHVPKQRGFADAGSTDKEDVSSFFVKNRQLLCFPCSPDKPN